MDKYRKIYQKYKSEVIVSLITAFICFLLKSIIIYIKDGGKIVTDLLINYFYYKMGRISNLAILEVISSFILAFFIAFLIVVSIHFIFGYKLNKSNIVIRKKSKKLTGLLCVISIMIFFIYFFTLTYCIESKHKFDLQMTALKPYILEKEYDMLYSEWVTMMGKDDYQRIQKEIHKLKCEYVITDKEIRKIICKK